MPLLGYCQFINSSFSKTFCWAGFVVDDNLDGECSFSEDYFVAFPDRGKISLDFHKSDDEDILYITFFLPSEDNEGFIESPPFKLKDVEIIKMRNNYVVQNKNQEHQFTLLNNSEDNESVFCLVYEPSLAKIWFLR